MESAKTPIKINHVLYSRVVAVTQEKKKRWVSGHGNETVFDEVDMGYYLHLEGLHEKLFMGFDKPAYGPGDHMKITFERYDPCPPSPTTNQPNS